jgi:hypothetical protein
MAGALAGVAVAAAMANDADRKVRQ